MASLRDKALQEIRILLEHPLAVKDGIPMKEFQKYLDPEDSFYSEITKGG